MGPLILHQSIVDLIMEIQTKIQNKAKMPAKLKVDPTGCKMPPKLKLKVANECENLSSKVNLTVQKKEFKYFIAHAKQINELNYDKMMSIFEPLMHEMYENSNWGWNEEEKLSEWKNPKTRVIFVVPKDQTERGGKSLFFNQLPDDDEQIIGFMCFRFEVGADKSESALYVYELHINPDYQRQGLGEQLMQMARNIGAAFKMDKIMLTVFRSNLIAQQFYTEKLKFSTDKSTPAKNEADYIILSSRIKS